jgi:hypothetical protein
MRSARSSEVPVLTDASLYERGLATLIASWQAYARCTPASLQSTPMAERVYAAIGFRHLGRFLEYLPPLRAGEDAQRCCSKAVSI